ncbi:hypothetical protein [Breoghania sp.]|uniref:hypothetical protein n=1 Tax=Breoghania sp. TaxID=2065378 RepID=UPI002AA8421A|nr:hypothetical protein [Breoghania sp.]
MTTAKDILSAIFARHAGMEWVNFAEVPDSTGARARRRADAICFNVWPSKGFAIHGFEIKVTRADFIHEMKDITKAKAISKYCDFWWLAAPVGMVSVDEVPASWGLMELRKDGLKIKKQAPQAEAPEVMNRGIIASILRESRKPDDAYIQTRVEQIGAAHKADITRQMQQRETELARRSKANAEWIAAFEEKVGIPFSTWKSPEAMAERMRVAESLEFGSVSRLMTACAHVVYEVGALGKAMNDGRQEPTS